MPIRRGATKLPAGKAMPFNKAAQDPNADDATPPMGNARGGAMMPATQKSHAPGGVKRRPAKFGKM